MKRSRSQARDALGALKETIGAVGHLEELLRSTRVAPRAVAAVLPDVAATLPSLLAELEGAMVEQRERFAADELFLFLQDDVRALGDALGGALTRGRTLSAGARLGLERTVSSIEQRLLGALPLFELLIEIAEDAPMLVDVRELLLLLRDGDQSHGLRGESVGVEVEADAAQVWLSSTPRAGLTLISIAASLLRERVVATGMTIQLERVAGEATARAKLTITTRVPKAPLFKLVLPPKVAASEPCLGAIARAMSMDLRREAERVTLCWVEPAAG
jgi:hypothetical protein